MLSRFLALLTVAGLSACAGPADMDGGTGDALVVIDSAPIDAPPPRDAMCAPDPAVGVRCTAVVAVHAVEARVLEYTLDCCDGFGMPECPTVDQPTEASLRSQAGVSDEASLLFWNTVAVFLEGSSSVDARAVVFDGIFDRVALTWSSAGTTTPSAWMDGSELGHGCEPTSYEDTVGFDAATGNPLDSVRLDEIRAVVMDTELPHELPGFGGPAPLFVIIGSGDVAYVVLTAINFS